MNPQDETKPAGLAENAGLTIPANAIRGFELRRVIGCGGMGMVYEALNLGTKTTVALKVMVQIPNPDPSAVERLNQEALMAQVIKHPNIVEVYSFGSHGLYYYIEMEYVRGFNAFEYLKQWGTISCKKVAAIGIFIASALGEAWDRKKMIHRDVKPQNIIIVEDPQDGALINVKLCDLGIAKVLDPHAASFTRTGFMVGTPHYVAPEQVKGKDKIDFRADIYALGATLYHLVTGHTVHNADSEFLVVAEHVEKVVQDPRTFVPDLNPRLAVLLNNMLRLKPDERTGSWRDVFDELVAILETDEEVAGKIRIPSPTVGDKTRVLAP